MILWGRANPHKLTQNVGRPEIDSLRNNIRREFQAIVFSIQNKTSWEIKITFWILFLF